MVRAIIFFVLLGAIALGAGWLVDRPGGVEIVWLGHRISTSVTVLAAVVALIVALSIFLWSIIRAVWRAPSRLSHTRRARRIAKGHHAIAHGLIAIGAGDTRGAAKHAADAQRFAAHEPLALLLGAQAAQLAGDRAEAEKTFGVMAARSDTKLLGLHGLFVEARRRDDAAAARALAEEAARTSPSLGWAQRAVLEFRSAIGDWAGAIAALESNRASGLADKASYRRQRAVLLVAQAHALAETDRDQAKALAVEAAKLAPDFVPAAALAGRFHAEAGDTRKATRVIEAAWKSNPHPDLAEAYLNARPGDSARERLTRVQKLAKQYPDHIEGALAVARAAIDAQDYPTARAALAPYIAEPTQRVALLMAELEEADSGNIGRAREWMARAVHAARDAVWTAEGVVSKTWRAVSPSGRLDAFEWKVPVTALPGTVIEAHVVPARPVIAPAAPPALDADGEHGAEVADAESGLLKPIRLDEARAPESLAPSAGASAMPSAAAKKPMVEPVIPLVHAPDDPGPDHEPEAEPVPSADGRPRRGLFG